MTGGHIDAFETSYLVSVAVAMLTVMVCSRESGISTFSNVLNSIATVVLAAIAI